MQKNSVSLYRDIENDFQQNVEKTINEILGENITESQKEEFYDYISIIFRKYSKNYLNQQRSKLIESNTPINQLNCNNFNSSINIYLLTSAPNTFPQPTFGYPQPQIFPNITPNPYQIPNIQSQQLSAPPNAYYYNLAQPQSQLPSPKKEKSKSSSKKEKSKSKSSSKKHHRKSGKDDKKSQKKPKGKKSTFQYDDSKNNYFEGIINYLTQKCGGNVSKQNVVIVSGSSQFSSYSPENAVDLQNRSTFFEALNRSRPNEWIKYDFKDRTVRPNFYSIRANNNHNGEDNLRNWAVEGSNDDITWKVLDSRNMDTFLSRQHAVHAYQITEKLDKYETFRFLRLRSTGRDSSEDFIFSLSALEFFGDIYE